MKNLELSLVKIQIVSTARCTTMRTHGSPTARVLRTRRRDTRSTDRGTPTSPAQQATATSDATHKHKLSHSPTDRQSVFGTKFRNSISIMSFVATASSRMVVKARPAVQQRRTFLNWMVNYPDKVRGRPGSRDTVSAISLCYDRSDAVVGPV
jgi:hypothetical protein